MRTIGGISCGGGFSTGERKPLAGRFLGARVASPASFIDDSFDEAGEATRAPGNCSHRFQRFSLLVLALLLGAGAGRGAHALPNTPNSLVPQTNGPVYALLQVGHKIYVGGKFTTIGGVARNGLAAFNDASGAVDPYWDPNIQRGTAKGTVYALAADAQRLYVGGDFDTANGATARNSLAAFPFSNGARVATVDAKWDPRFSTRSDGTGSPRIRSVSVSGAFAYIAGTFGYANGAAITRGRLAAVEPADGANIGAVDPAWQPVSSELLGNDCRALASNPARVFAAGTTIWTPDNYPVLYATVGANGVNSGNPVTSLAEYLSYSRFFALVLDAGHLYTGPLAAFGLDDGVPTGPPDPSWHPTIDGGGWPNALAIVGSQLIVGGQFSTVNGTVARNNLAAFELANGVNTGAVDPFWNPDIGPALDSNTQVYAVAPSNHGVIVGGAFTTVGGQPRAYLAGFDAMWHRSAAEHWDEYDAPETGN